MNSFVSLMYHNVVEDGATFPELSPSVTSYFVDRSTFAAHIQEMCLRGSCIDVESMKQFYAVDDKPNRAVSTGNAVQITFDDGWLGSIDLAGQILEGNGIQGIVFITSDLVGCPHFVDEIQLRRLKNQTIQIGAHGKTHRMLNRLSEQEIRDELTQSKNYLEDVLGSCVDMLSIPGGATDDRVQSIAAEVGYEYIFTSEVHRNPHAYGARNIGRIAIRNTTKLSDVSRYVQHNLRREQWRRGLLSVPKRMLGRKLYAALRRRLLGETDGQREMLDIREAGDITQHRAENSDWLDNEILNLQVTQPSQSAE